jgi:ADP-ribose pyrophosphatase YjhB (NUDIX family)
LKLYNPGDSAVQVYAVYYEPSGRFLIGYKLIRGYYFYKSSTGQGSLVPAGQQLNGGGKYALPGGKREGQEAIADAAAREFKEETAQQVVADHTDTKEFSDEQYQYAAAFFRISLQTFNTAAVQIVKTNLPAGLEAKDAVINGSITKYAQIHQRYPHAPQDNELGDAHVWDGKDATDWSIIAEWENDPDLGWYYQILLYFKQSIL